MAYHERVEPAERLVIDAILNEAEARHLLVSVYDGEEWAVTATGNMADVRREVAATEATVLAFRDPAQLSPRDGRPSMLGRVILVHGNGCDVISDHTDTREMAALLAPALAVADQLSGMSVWALVRHCEGATQ